MLRRSRTVRLKISRSSAALVASVLLAGLSGCVPSFGASPAGVYRVRTDGTGLERVSGDPAAPVWSPDGDAIAWSGGQGVWIADDEGLETRRLVASPRPGTPAWRPDGGALAVVDNEEGLLKIVPLDGADIVTVPLLSEEQRERGALLPLRDQPSWSPDGRQLAVVAWDGSGDEVFVVEADGTGIERLSSIRSSGDPIDRSRPAGPTRALADAARPAWSPDGDQIAFALIPEVARATGGVYVIGADGSLQRRQTPIVPLAGPLWSPDGRSLLFVGRRADATDLFLLFPQRRTLRNLTNETELVPRDAAWAPDGGTVVFSADGALYLLDPVTESVEPLVDTPLEDLSPAWSPDGEWIAFRSEEDLFRQSSLPTIP